MAYQRGGSNQGGGYQRNGGRPQGNRPRPWNRIHQQMFEALYEHPRMTEKTGRWLESMQGNREPTNAMKSMLCATYAEWFHRPNREIIIHPFEDNGQYGQQQQQTGQQRRQFGQGRQQPPPEPEPAEPQPDAPEPSDGEDQIDWA